MANATRFTTAELAELETRIGRAADRALALELAIFDELVAEAMAGADRRRRGRPRAGRRSMSPRPWPSWRRASNYVRPAIDDEPRLRHRGRPPSGGRGGAGAAGRLGLRRPTIAISATARRLWLLTGPNMAGKSTFLRQNALIAILAQAGSFVPAKRATHRHRRPAVQPRRRRRRPGARPLDLHGRDGRDRGDPQPGDGAAAWSSWTRSAAAPRPSTACRSPGRRSSICTTSTAAARCSPRTIHELGALKERLAALAPYTMRVKEWQDEVVFLHEVAPGAADRSYGIHVAQLAGLPAAVVARAEEVLAALEKGEQSGAVTRLADDLPLFAAAPTRPRGTSPSHRNRKSRRRSATSIPTSSRRARRWSCSTACANASSLNGARASGPASAIMSGPEARAPLTPCAYAGAGRGTDDLPAPAAASR